jgi:hypothetical protein
MHELGYDIEGKHVHHLDHDRSNNDPANLAVLTISEHMEHHGSEWNSGQFQPQTHCTRGHEFTAANTYITPGSGARACRACKSQRNRQRYLSQKAS